MKLHFTDSCPSSEFSQTFLQSMLDRMGMSFLKYGRIRDAYPEKVSALDSLQLRIKKYKETGNTEHLIDVANYAMIEFLHPSVEGAYFRPLDSRGSPGRIWHDSKTPNMKTNEENL